MLRKGNNALESWQMVILVYLTRPKKEKKERKTDIPVAQKKLSRW